MGTRPKPSRLTDPHSCIQDAERLLIPMTTGNWAMVKDEAESLNVLQAAITHLVYLDTERTEFQQRVMEIVFTAYLMGRTADLRLHEADLGAIGEFLATLDLSDLPAPGTGH